MAAHGRRSTLLDTAKRALGGALTPRDKAAETPANTTTHQPAETRPSPLPAAKPDHYPGDLIIRAACSLSEEEFGFVCHPSGTEGVYLLREAIPLEANGGTQASGPAAVFTGSVRVAPDVHACRGCQKHGIMFHSACRTISCTSSSAEANTPLVYCVGCKTWLTLGKGKGDWSGDFHTGSPASGGTQAGTSVVSRKGTTPASQGASQAIVPVRR